MSAVRVLACNLDTLHLFTRTPIRRKLVTALEARQEEAAARHKRQPLPTESIAGHTLTMQRHGVRTAPLLLTSEHMDVKVNPYAADNLPTVALELRALYLWQLGAAEACRQAQAVMDALTDPPMPGDELARVTRADLACDFQGWLPALTDNDRFMARATSRAMYQEGQAFTGFKFGAGVVGARLYDKTAELQKSDKAWFREVWAQAPSYDPQASVWRLEYQLRREALRSMRVRTEEGEAVKVDTWQDVLAFAPLLWRHLTGRWLALRLPRTRSTRQRLAPEWEQLRAAGFTGGPWTGSGADLYRLKMEAGSESTKAQLAGYLARAYAEHRFHTDIGATFDGALPVVVESARRHAERSGRTVEQRAGERVRQWVQEAESIALGTEADVAPSEDFEEGQDPGRDPDGPAGRGVRTPAPAPGHAGGTP